MPKKGIFEKKKPSVTILLSSCLHILFPINISHKSYYNIISLPWAPIFFYHSISFASPIAKPIGPHQWLM